ncbi:MAG: ribonuclease J [Desulfovibrionaceae bacterium]|nr:ribonuclease J [Desulfovibrionaceae bacterium]
MSEKSALLTIYPLGGYGEIGMNCTLLETGQGCVLIDCGLMFPEDYHLGVDVVIPPLDMILENADRLLGIVLTHGHEDHIGALPWLLPDLAPGTPIYGSTFTLALVEHRLRENELLDRVRLMPVEPGQRKTLGDIVLYFFPVSHSIIQGMALGMDTPAGRMLHTGDFKLDPSDSKGWSTDIEAYRNFSANGLTLLMSDSTNVEKEGFSVSEAMVANALEKLCAKAGGRVIITLFSSNIQRIQSVFNIASVTGRSVMVEGRSLVNNIQIAIELGILRPPKNIYLDLNEAPQLADSEVILLVTGSQGEPMSALARIAAGEHKQLIVHEGDTVIMSSRSIPGNGRNVTKLIDKLYRQGAEVFYDDLADVHASGHAYKEELKLLFKAVRPKFFIPVHGEYRHLVKHARLAQECGVMPENTIILENGEPVSFSAEGFCREQRIPAESLLVDGKMVGDVGRQILRERRAMGEEGLVIVSIVRDEVSGALVQGPDLVSRGFIFEQQFSHILEDARDIAIEIVENNPDATNEQMYEKVRIPLRRFFRSVVGRNPVVLPVIVSV